MTGLNSSARSATACCRCRRSAKPWATRSSRSILRASCSPGHRHYHPGGFVHAGFAATLLDSAMACAVITTLAKGEMSATLEFKINLVRMLTAETGPVRAEGRVVHRGRTVATADAELRDE